MGWNLSLGELRERMAKLEGLLEGIARGHHRTDRRQLKDAQVLHEARGVKGNCCERNQGQFVRCPKSCPMSLGGEACDPYGRGS